MLCVTNGLVQKKGYILSGVFFIFVAQRVIGLFGQQKQHEFIFFLSGIFVRLPEMLQ